MAGILAHADTCRVFQSQITIWGTSADGDSEVNDYANKLWAGLISGFYHPRCGTGHLVWIYVWSTP